MKYEDQDIDKPIFIVMVILSVLLISKIVFFISIGCLVAGVIWYLRTKDSKQSRMAMLMIGLSLFLVPVTYIIGYRIENVEMFHVVFDYLASFSKTIF